MFRKIMMPVDLSHAAALERATGTAVDLARHWGAELVFVGVTADAPSATARTPEEYGRTLAAFAAETAGAGVRASAHPVVTNDPAHDLDAALLEAVEATGADLVVMATHVPGLGDRLWPGHGGKLAGHVGCSVLLVRAG